MKGEVRSEKKTSSLPFKFSPSSLPPLSLYIHIPWCVRKCPYCDFNSHAVKDELPEQAYLDALSRDLQYDAELIQDREIQTIFIGGGTPSLFAPEAIGHLLHNVRQHFTLTPNVEITLEANPGTVDTARFEGFRKAGVNRLSIGVQSFNENALLQLGRIHGRSEAEIAAKASLEAGFDNFNLDLMFGLPRQKQAGALADLERAIQLQPPHLSWYQLTLEPNTLFYRQPPPLPDDDDIWEMQQAGQALLAQHGYAQYEISAYAQAERQCLHNLNYWQFGDYLAIGAGAHGKLTNASSGEIMRYSKVRHPKNYLAAESATDFIDTYRTLHSDDLCLEFMLNALRLSEGVPTEFFTARTGLALDEVAQAIELAQQNGWLETSSDIIRPTPLGSQFLNDLLALFLPEDD
ncbi:MAG: radical SAM family heme chaperone HemW [Pseudomonadota bacterium]